MKEVIRKEVLYDLGRFLEFLNGPLDQNAAPLKDLSDHAIEDVAVHKDLDVISVTVLIYSVYKILPCLRGNEHAGALSSKLGLAIKALERKNFGLYNRLMKEIFNVVRSCSDHIKEHLQDVMQAARIKKGTALLEKGLSMGQAAGLMGLSNWDLQVYAAKTTAIEVEGTSLPALGRMKQALSIFGVS